MTSESLARKRGSDRGDYGYARIRDLAFDAVLALWRKRKAQGMKQGDVAAILNRNPGWVSKQFRGPSNWTLRTIGELIEALDGEVEIIVRPLEEPDEDRRNSDAYSGYGHVAPKPSVEITTGNSGVPTTLLERQREFASP
jgi:hypothetical protein